MSSAMVRPETLEEKVIFWSIVSTWGIWVIGGLYIFGPVLGWSLAALSLARRLGLMGDAAPHPTRLPIGCRLWLGAVATMAVALFVGHIELGLGQLVKSFMGWMKGWALIAVFIYVGATMTIRPAVVYRATNVLAAQTLALVPIFLLFGLLRLPNLHFVSPLKIFGGAGADYFTFELYGLDPETKAARWSFFSPWAPAASLVGNVSLVMALYEKNRMWRLIGLAAAVAVAIMTQSRLSFIVTPILGLLIIAMSNLTRPMMFSAGTAVCVTALPMLEVIAQLIRAAEDRFKNARASSSRVRATLQSIALHRWWNEAPIWGHGTVERGPHLVEFMPIGSHHTWNALLYVKGIVGFTALAVPFAWSFVELTAKAQTDRVARAALGVMLVLFIYTFAENLEVLIYLYWPGMVIVGIAMKRRFVQPFHAFLGH